MFKRKTTQWLLQGQNASQPLLLREMTPQDDIHVIAAFLRKKIGSKDLRGIIDPEDEIFTPSIYFSQIISRKLESLGVIDICDLIDATSLPGNLIEHQLTKNLQNIKGFYDVIKRKFYTLAGAKRELKQLLGVSTSFDLKYLLNSIYWTDDHLESILDLLAHDGKFYGYIDPIKHRLYNFTSFDFTSSANLKKKIDYLQRFIKTNFALESEVSLSDISKITQLPQEDCLSLLEKHRNEINFIFSSNYDYLYPTIQILKQVLKDIYVYHFIPIDFWIMRLDVDRSDFISFLNKINRSLQGKLTADDFEVGMLTNWFNNGIDVEGLASELSIDPLELLDLIVEFAKFLDLRIITGEIADPFLVRGIKDFDIFCQVDTSSYKNPKAYFECQNCRRVMCSNCRSTGSKHECPFCGNISAFIIDLPRHCSHCKVNYTHSFNLVSSEKCHFCQKGPMKVGWVTDAKPVSIKSEMDPKFRDFLAQKLVHKILIQEIISLLGYTDKFTISLLEDYILRGWIRGYINIRDLSLELELDTIGFTCSVCDLPRSDPEKYICKNCKVNVCNKCYNEMETVGMVFCSECGGDLQQYS
ncbi:MAG: hypothetical protein ACXACU_04535 [Candidatus Hodarchaeales archaeon]|jgi:hypothetical protein